MREPERDWPRAYAQPWRVRLADRAAAAAGLPPGGEGYVRANPAARGPDLVEVAGAGPTPASLPGGRSPSGARS